MAVTKKTAPEKAALSKKPAVKKAIPAKKPAKQKKGRYGAVPKYPSPPAKSIKHLRESVPGLLQQHAAVLVKSNLSTYGKWETGVVPMHPALWELLQIKVGQLLSGEIAHPSQEIALGAKKPSKNQ